jgi:LDH2 family malate/lactate/ureidoglycolate dehydrogenase
MLGELRSWNMGDPAHPTGHGHAFLAINVAAMVPLHEFTKRVEEMVRRIRGAAKAKGSDRVWLPGEMEAERMKHSLAHGMVLPPDVLASLRGLAEDVGMHTTL